MNPGPLLVAKIGPWAVLDNTELGGNPLLAAEIRSRVHARFV